MNYKLPIILAVGMIIASVALYAGAPYGRVVWAEEGKPEDVSESLRPTTYTPPTNIYLPEMMFLVVKDTDSLVIARCKNMTYRTVDAFSRRENSNLVRADKKLKTLAYIIKQECIDVSIDTHRKGL